MGWFIFGLLSAFGVETFIRICGDYERVEKPPTEARAGICRGTGGAWRRIPLRRKRSRK